MRVILLENVIGLGKAGEIKEVRDGYGRNHLIPKKLAVLATKEQEHHFQRLAAKLAEKAKQQFENAMQLKDSLEKETLEISARVGEGGRLFGSITNTDVANLLAQKGYTIEKRKIVNEHIKTVGEHTVRIRLDEGVTAEVKLVVKPE
ncbi:50S ribosomal protein L9 [Thermospira aquatica]|uniref:Large ribosomal subunit protein bL9 n=1 Tax=Thermospira aquatica TaxID=2828656 RepID=A0AAX3BEJ8_9SPIR|nr:50S ribosomal protein L9 [Thermospira aquatica]URA10768.1 50S ribosomal protein L9 [Thermospira aquatica]